MRPILTVGPARPVRPAAAPGWWLLAGGLLGAVGCAGPPDDRVPTQPATGRVTVAGKAAPGALVTLHPAGGGLHPRGTAGADGTFTLSTYEQGDGAPAGDYRVTVVWPDPDFKPRTPGEVEELRAGGQAPDKLRGRYAGPESSGLTATVGPGPNELGPLELK